MSESQEPLKITYDDLSRLEETTLAEGAIDAAEATGPGSETSVKRYGNIRDAVAPADAGPVRRGSILLKSWFYLGAAGFLGALAGWGLVEPAFVDGPDKGDWDWLGSLMIPSVVAFCCLGCAIAESVVERSWRKALIRGGLAFALGIPLGFVFSFVASILYNLLLGIASMGGEITPAMPSWWAARSVAWGLFGVSAGVVYGVAGLSARKLLYGVLGGMLGAGIGGILFDPIANQLNSGDLSRAVGFAVFGLSTGVAMGLVESALKERWLYVAAGPLAGKQFILYKPVTTIGRSQGCDIYLFKDPSIQNVHASLERRGPGLWLTPRGPVYMGGSPSRPRMLKHKDQLQIGRYTFLYQERRPR
ncbi:MAG: FHA domain-containing protein [Bryobacterales bacterium]|nr:FHA domain-containing protein [Bryobacterales bacterium]